MPSTALRTWPTRVRRVLLGRDNTGWFPVWVAYFATSICFGSLRHVHRFPDGVAALALLVFLAAAIGRLDGYATRKAPLLMRPRSRWWYALVWAGCFGLGVGAGVLGAWLNGSDSWWGGLIAGGLNLLAAACAVGGVIALGRAVFTGNRRRAFWRHPPAWLGTAASPRPVPPLTPDPYPGDLGTFDVILWSRGSRPIRVIKEVRKLTPLGLKEAKDLVDSAPSLLLSRVSKQAADEAMAALTQAGAVAVIR